MKAGRRPSKEERICVGVITGAHGVRGQVKIKSFTEEPADVGTYGPVGDETGGRSFAIEVTGRVKGLVIARLEGVADRARAEALKGTKLYVGRDVLPAPADDEYYAADLVGLRAERAGGGDLGRIAAVHDFGAGPLLELAGGPAAGAMVPFTRAIVREVDLARGRVVIDPPPGLLEADKDEEST